ncbi:redox-regulatory protein FAM213A-like isoform X1 [Lates japonicus]
MLALSRCLPALRWTLPLRCSALSLASDTMSSQSSTTATPQILRTQTALFHQSRAKSNPGPNKPASGKDILDCLHS